MATLTFVQPNGERVCVAAELGYTVMEAAVNANVTGVEAECGGSCTCSTCHCYIDPAFIDTLRPPSPDERDLLQFAWAPRATSRLTCQIDIDELLDGMVVEVPAHQV